MDPQNTTDELIDHWTLLPAERELLTNKTGVTRLGFAVMLKAFRRDGRFPVSIADVPPVAVGYVARQIGLDPALYRSSCAVQPVIASLNTRSASGCSAR